MMPTLSLMDFPKDFQTFLRLNTALQYSGCTSVLNFAVDDGIAFGSSHDAPSFGFIFWQLSFGQIGHDWLRPRRNGSDRKEWFIDLHRLNVCFGWIMIDLHCFG